MLITETPALPPGACLLTSTSEGPFVDTGIDYDDLPSHGRVYLAMSSVMDLAQLGGAVPPDAASRREAYVADLEGRLREALTDIEGLKVANQQLVAAGYGRVIEMPPLTAQVPTGSVGHVRSWIEAVEEPVLRAERAAAVIEVETAAAKPRSTVIAAAEKYVVPVEAP